MSSQTVPPHLSHPKRVERAKFAKETINRLVPHILQHNPRAQLGNASTERIYYQPGAPKASQKAPSNSRNASSSKPKVNTGKITGYFQPLRKDAEQDSDRSEQAVLTVASEPRESKEHGQNVSRVKDEVVAQASTYSTGTASKSQPRVSVVQSDTLDAAQVFVDPSAKDRRITVLNMASFLRPGGGVINGSLAQEESLCLRSTLYPALDERFYRLPKYGGLFTKDILVFRDSDNQNLQKSEWYFVDVISVAALKNPDLVKTTDGKAVYEHEKDREDMISKIKLILYTAVKQKTTHLILGALGCGAYNNPPEEVAKMFRRVLFGDKHGRGALDLAGIEEIVFAIFDDGVNLQVFRTVLEGGQGPQTQSIPGNKAYEGQAKGREGRDIDMTDVIEK